MIDAALSEHRRSGAYSTEYADPPEPRVFLTFEGTLDNVITLAHELGHAWHSWLLRELPLEQRDYPKTLAETASLFAEALVRDALLAATDNMEQRRAIAWLDGGAPPACCSTCRPALPSSGPWWRRGRRATWGRPAAADDESAQQQWYGDTLSQYDELFWASRATSPSPSSGSTTTPTCLATCSAWGSMPSRRGRGASSSTPIVSCCATPAA